MGAVPYAGDSLRIKGNPCARESECIEEGGFSRAEGAGTGEEEQFQAAGVQGINEGRLQILSLLRVLNEFALNDHLTKQQNDL
jgi:hypothetical protein